jgi:hypothetical protein
VTKEKERRERKGERGKERGRGQVRERGGERREGRGQALTIVLIHKRAPAQSSGFGQGRVLQSGVEWCRVV